MHQPPRHSSPGCAAFALQQAPVGFLPRRNCDVGVQAYAKVLGRQRCTVASQKYVMLNSVHVALERQLSMQNL